jgi:signal transduction histidine kinase
MKMKESREQLRSLSRRLVVGQGNEHRDVARELYDEAGQVLTSPMIQLKLVQREANDPEAVLERAADLVHAVEEVMENLHRLAMDLRPVSLDHLGLVATMRQYCPRGSGRETWPSPAAAAGRPGRSRSVQVKRVFSAGVSGRHGGPAI